MPTPEKSGVVPALLEAIQHARMHRKSDIALSLAFALERHRLGNATDSAPPPGWDEADGSKRPARYAPPPPPPRDGHAHRK